MELVNFRKAKFQKNKLILDETLSIDEWKELGSQLKRVEGSVQFWIGDWARFGDKKGFSGKYTDSKVYDELEEITGLSRGTIKNIKSVAESTSSFRHDDLSFTHHQEVAKLSPEKQKEFLNKASDEKLSVRQLSYEIKKNIINERNAEIESQRNTDTNIIKGLYDVISVDPPWQYGREYDPQSSRVASPYPEMSIEDIANIVLPAKENSVLFLWTTHKFLPDSFNILNQWGYEYKSIIVWNKIKMGMGSWFRMQCEFCLFAIKGKPAWSNVTERDIIEESRREHSRKPDAFFDMVAKICYGKKLEYFSREKRDGWDVFGNDINKF